MAIQTVLSYEVLELTGLAPNGEATGKLGGLLVYVPFALPGERVRVELVEKKGATARAKLIEVLTPSPDRATAPCPYFGRCGGCNWQNMRYSTQLLHKRELVRNELANTAKLSDPQVRPCVPSFHEYGYRNSARFGVLANGRPAYPAAHAKGYIAVDECPILEPVLEEALQKAALVGVTTRREWDIRVPEPIAVGNFDYYVGPKSAFPVNTLVADRLVEEVVTALEPSAEQSMLDLFCGVGLFTLPLAVMCADVIGVEPNADEARDTRRNLASIRNRLYHKSPRILTNDVSSALSKPEIKSKRWHGLVYTPPNGETNLITGSQIAKLRVPRLVYVSSNVATMGREVKNFTLAGYRLDYAQPLDMFPQSRQVLTVVCLRLGA